MSIVSLLNVNIQDNPAPFTKPFNLEITFECLEQLTKGSFLKDQKLRFSSFTAWFIDWLTCLDLEWKLTYVGSATS